MMIARIVVGSGSSRTVVSTSRDRDERRSLGAAIKRHLFPSDGAYHKAKRRGQRALAGA